MRLIDLNPRWIAYSDDGARLGLSFECPHCRTQRLAVAFHYAGHEAMDDAVIRAKNLTGNIWNMTGNSFENISLTPSVDASHVGHWHGFITNGEAK